MMQVDPSLKEKFVVETLTKAFGTAALTKSKSGKTVMKLTDGATLSVGDLGANLSQLNLFRKTKKVTGEGGDAAANLARMVRFCRFFPLHFSSFFLLFPSFQFVLAHFPAVSDGPEHVRFEPRTSGSGLCEHDGRRCHHRREAAVAGGCKLTWLVPATQHTTHNTQHATHNTQHINIHHTPHSTQQQHQPTWMLL